MFLIIIALQTEKSNVGAKVTDRRQWSNPTASRWAHTPAVTRVGHVELSEQAGDSEGRASACDIIDLLLLLNLGVLGTGETVTLIFNETSAKKRGQMKSFKKEKKKNLPHPPTCEMS